MRRLVLLVLLPLFPLLSACQEPMRQSPDQQMMERGRGVKDCTDCTAMDFPGGPNSFTKTFCAAATTCVNGNQTALQAAANEECRSLNTQSCTGDCPGSRHCEGILNPDSNWAALNVAAVQGPACPGVNQVECTATVTIPAGRRLDCKCSCNP